MHPIIYDVAVSIDGYISGADGDVSLFDHDGPVAEDYQARIADYTVAIMGKNTYEFGYRFGMEPGQNPYGHMKTMVFSRSLDLPSHSEVSLHKTSDTLIFQEIKKSSSGPIYLCGGGAFAGALLSMGQIDILRLKRAPIVLGAGVRLFGEVVAPFRLRNSETKTYKNGYVFQEFTL